MNYTEAHLLWEEGLRGNIISRIVGACFLLGSPQRREPFKMGTPGHEEAGSRNTNIGGTSKRPLRTF